MRRTAITAGLILIIGLSAPLSWGASVSGTVVDDISQTPLPKVSAEVFGYRPVSRISLHADENGVFQTGDLGPGEYTIVFGTRASGCRAPGHPVLDISNALTGSIEAQMTNPGVVRGHAGPTQEVILVPDDFTEGWSFLVANWFPASEGDFGVKSGFAVRGGQGDEFYVRIAAADSEGKFEFTEVPAGRYRIVVRSADPAIKDEKREMRRIDVPSGGVMEIDLAAP